ncbi:MAG: threonine--tRNA ligase, partial [Abditibacteriota bacterium]|nr:threonine--tRNA ligase [Abditibacteriota bacterium]
SLERFFGILIEHYAGAFPLWLAPVQVAVCPITDNNADYCRKIYEQLLSKGFRCQLYDMNEPLKAKIKAAELEKIPYMLIVGDRDMEQGKVSVRSRKEGDKGAVTPEEFVAILENDL